MLLPELMSIDWTEQLQRRTAAHYDAYPFEFLTPQEEIDIASLQPAPFRRFISEHAKPGMRVGEIGCGPGRGTMYLVQNRLNVVALDLSRNSIALARGRAPNACFVQGTNLKLPFADDSFELVVSDGVIHHTPDAYRAFAENVRVLKPRGHLYLGVYNRHRYYYYIYTYLSPLLRRMESASFGRIVIYITAFPLYYLVHLLKSRGKRSIWGARNFFYDYVMTPHASFHTREQVVGWGATIGLDLLAYDRSLGNIHVFIFRKAEKDIDLVESRRR